MEKQNKNLNERLQSVLGLYEKDLTDDQLVEHVSKLNKLARRVVINDVHTKFWLDCWVPVEKNSDVYFAVRGNLDRAAIARGESITALQSFYRDNALREDTETGKDIECLQNPVESDEKQ